ncbi:MAG: branched-chain amino acid aminotransferase [Desulfovibrio sp.]|jgi:branched-chain amino acid aminotransferase|nr:branched-chain amino acid aminotransferase [Desulfovibrio sp.]
MQFVYNLLPASRRKTPPADEHSLGFGLLRTNHMFLMEYSDGEWHSPRIEPYGPVSLMPGAMCFHYGQTLFEGIKAFRHPDGEIYLFRADKNAERLNASAEILCMPRVPTALQLEALNRLIDVERAWCPSAPQSSLYIRPFMFATQDGLGVRPSRQYYYCIMLSPSGAYYSGGFSQAIRLLVTKKFHRAAVGGTGASKCGGNYVASLRAAEYAHTFKAHQVLYLNEANTHIEEVGSMNHYHVRKDGVFVIPEFTDTILRSITSISVLELAAAGRIAACQEPVALDAFLDDVRSGEITEAGGFGTAAVVSPVGQYVFEDGMEITVADGKPGPHSGALYELYSSYQTGRAPAPEGWLVKVPRF